MKRMASIFVKKTCQSFVLHGYSTTDPSCTLHLVQTTFENHHEIVKMLSSSKKHTTFTTPRIPPNTKRVMIIYVPNYMILKSGCFVWHIYQGLFRAETKPSRELRISGLPHQKHFQHFSNKKIVLASIFFSEVERDGEEKMIWTQGERLEENCHGSTRLSEGWERRAVTGILKQIFVRGRPQIEKQCPWEKESKRERGGEKEGERGRTEKRREARVMKDQGKCGGLGETSVTGSKPSALKRDD